MVTSYYSHREKLIEDLHFTTTLGVAPYGGFLTGPGLPQQHSHHGEHCWRPAPDTDCRGAVALQPGQLERPDQPAQLCKHEAPARLDQLAAHCRGAQQKVACLAWVSKDEVAI